VGALLIFRRMLSRIFAAIAVFILPAFSPAFGQDSQSYGDISIRAYDNRSESRSFRIRVASPDRHVTRSELDKIERFITGEDYRVPWGTIPQLPYYVECPTGIGWTPCAPYNETIYLSCVVAAQNSSSTGRASFEAQELCLRRATNPSVADRLRYR
jgi:hypothetical protein